MLPKIEGSNLLQDALKYLHEGFPVIPLQPKGKKPLVSWQEYQQRPPTEEEVKEWWDKWPDANIGIVTGKGSGLVVVDVDGEKGLETAKGLGLPEGPTVKTGRGYHHYFRHPGNGGVSNFQRKAGIEGIDLRGDGGYVVAPPSVHPSGETYRWVIPLGSMPLATLPDSILTISPSDKTPVGELLNGVPEGERNNSLARLSGFLFAQGWNHPEVLQFSINWNTLNKPLLTEREVGATVESIYKRHLISCMEAKDSFPAPIESDRAGNELWTPVPITELKDAPPIDWLWDGYIARSKITELVGIWKSGKTTLVAHLLRETAYGGELVGKSVDKAKVLIISEEDSSEWKDRKEEYGLCENIALICIPFKTKPSWKEWEAFVKHIAELVSSYDLVVIDTIATNWPVRNENDNSEVIEALMPLRQWTEQRACVLIIHHSRKGDGQEGQASRGAGGLPAFVDIILEFRRYDPSREDDTRRTIKGYSRRKETPKEVVIELTDDRYVLLGNKSEATASNRLTMLQSLIPIGKPPGFTVEEIIQNWPNGLCPGERTLRNDLETLYSKGKIERTGEGKKGSPYSYWIRNAFLASSPSKGQETNPPPSEGMNG